MLNVYDKYERPEELPEYEENSRFFEALENFQHYLSNISQEDKDQITSHTNIIKKFPELAYLYARAFIRGRFIEAEPYMMKDPFRAYMYAKFVLSQDAEWTAEENHKGGRWPEAEPYIMKDIEISLYYAEGVIGGRFIDAEPIIRQNEYWWDKYKSEFGIE